MVRPEDNAGVEKQAIRLRGHHLFCTTINNHEGDPVYNPQFCANMRHYQGMMRRNPNQLIRIVPTCGDTCLHCPSRSEKDNKCVLYDYYPDSNEIDMKVLSRLGLKVGDTILSGELRKKVKLAYGSELPEMCFTECGFATKLGCAEGLRSLS